MTVSSGELSALLNEILSDARGWRVKKVYQPSADELVLSFEQSKRRLYISAAPRLGRIHLTARHEKMDDTPAPFAQQLRKHLCGARFFGFAKERGERLFALLFDGAQLWCRLFGKSGFLLCAEDGRVLGSAGFADAPLPGEPFAPPPPAGFDETAAAFDGAPCAVIEERYAALAAADRLEKERAAIVGAANAEKKKLNTLVKSMERDREKLRGFAAYKGYGDLCQTYYHQLKRGLSAVTLTDPATGEEAAIPLSPELSPRENVEALYKKHRKYVTGMAKLETALEDARRRLTALEEKIASARAAAAPDELPPRTEQKAGKGRKEKNAPRDSEGATFRRFISADGYDMLVGRNDRQNDELVKQANGNDLWFHIRGFPGSHVLVRALKGKDVPQGTIAEAARLAVKYSSRAKDGRGTVVYTHAKNLRRPKGAKPGAVLITREKTITVEV